MDSLHNAPLLSGRVYPTAPPGPPVQHGLLDLNPRSASDDLAVVVVDVGRVPFLTFYIEQPEPGQEIGIGGFPSFQLNSARDVHDINPSFHFGSINSLPATGYIQFDALTDHGNSGGPLFGRRTGMVYGVVTLIVQSDTAKAVQNNLALANQLSFLDYLWLPHVVYLRYNSSTSQAVPCSHPPQLADYSERDRNFFCHFDDAPDRP
jgi:hypothetical protein